MAVGAGTVALALVLLPWAVRRMIGPLPDSRPMPLLEALAIGSVAVAAGLVAAGLVAAAVTIRFGRGGRP